MLVLPSNAEFWCYTRDFSNDKKGFQSEIGIIIIIVSVNFVHHKIYMYIWCIFAQKILF